jgi:hypothetical protein
MNTDSFKKAGGSEKKMYGPRKILVCGYPAPEQSTLLYLLEENGFSDLPVVFVSNSDSGKTLKELIGLPHSSGLGEDSEMNRAVIMSGLAQKELYRLMAVYRLSELPSQLWASVTPVSEMWSVAQLLSESAAETEATKKQGEGVNKYVHR